MEGRSPPIGTRCSKPGGVGAMAAAGTAQLARKAENHSRPRGRFPQRLRDERAGRSSRQEIGVDFRYHFRKSGDAGMAKAKSPLAANVDIAKSQACYPLQWILLQE